jgi:hypothetical protein
MAVAPKDIGDGITTAQCYPCQTIEILPTTAEMSGTTRWRAQRDTSTPAKVTFRGPADLDMTTVKLKVIPPAAYTGPTYEPTAADIKKVSGTNDVYELQWKGPWVFGANSSPMPRGDYSLTVSGSRQGQSNVHESGVYTKVSLVEVVQVKLQGASGLALQRNPGPGDGVRAFAEATQTGGTVADKVKVIATIDPPILDAPSNERVRVHFRAFDVDDPSAKGAPIDDESLAADNCLEAASGPPARCLSANEGLLYDLANDPGAASPVDGSTGLAVTASADQAVAGLRVATQPGANYRVAASTSQAWLSGLNALQGVQKGELAHNSGESLVDANGGTPQVTEMLTVWRTLSLQLSRMQLSPSPQSAFDHAATATCSTPPCISGTRLEDVNGMLHPDHQATVDAWAGASLDITPATPRADKHFVLNSALTTLDTLMTLTPVDPMFRYVLWDDEVDSLSIWAQPNESLAASILKDAYIEVQAVAGISPPFEHNLTDPGVAALPTADTTSPEHWTAPVVLAFESDTRRDGDPWTEFNTWGQANAAPLVGSPAFNPAVAIFAETIRDFIETPISSVTTRVTRDELMLNTTAHEILHMFGLVHDGNVQDGGLMCGKLAVDATQANRQKITPNQQRQLRLASELKIVRPVDQVPSVCP